MNIYAILVTSLDYWLMQEFFGIYCVPAPKKCTGANAECPKQVNWQTSNIYCFDPCGAVEALSQVAVTFGEFMNESIRKPGRVCCRSVWCGS